MGKSGYLQDNDGEEFKGDEDNKLRVVHKNTEIEALVCNFVIIKFPFI